MWEQGCEVSVGDFVLRGRGDGAFGGGVGEAGMAELELDFGCERCPDEAVLIDETAVEGQFGSRRSHDEAVGLCFVCVWCDSSSMGNKKVVASSRTSEKKEKGTLYSPYRAEPWRTKVGYINQQYHR